MKGIVLAGGAGTRLYPLTMVTSKQLLPVYDKPMIYYPLSTLMLAGIREILIISTPDDLPRFQAFLGDGKCLGISLQYAVQSFPNGLAEAFLIGKDFISEEPCALILGDNFFDDKAFSSLFPEMDADLQNGYATICCTEVSEPKHFGIVELDEKGNIVSLEEKPLFPKSHRAVTGLYFYPAGVCAMAEKILPSARGDLEITSLNEMYRKAGKLKVYQMKKTETWFDMGTMESLWKAATFVQKTQEERGVKISAPEEIAYRKGWIGKAELLKMAEAHRSSSYGAYLLHLIRKEDDV